MTVPIVVLWRQELPLGGGGNVRQLLQSPQSSAPTFTRSQSPAPHQARLYLLTLNTPSLSSLPFTYLIQARPIVLTCVFSLPQTFLFLHRSSCSTYLLLERNVVFMAQPHGSCLIVHYSPLVTSCLSPLSLSINTLVLTTYLCLLACVVTLNRVLRSLYGPHVLV